MACSHEPRFPERRNPTASCSSLTKQRGGGIEPLGFAGNPEEVLDVIESVLREQPRMRRVSRTGTYLHFEAQTRICRFRDDVEILLDKAASKIHFRSSSRIGYYDFGTHRRRLGQIRERIREAFSGKGERREVR